MVKVTADGNRIVVAAPYHPDFPSRARKLGGVWNATPKTWVFDSRDEVRVRGLCQDIYGEDGTPVELVTVRVTIGTNGWMSLRDSLFLCGRCVARAYDRSSGARLGPGVIVEAGGFKSAGSRKNWYTEATAGTVFLIRDVPRLLAASETLANASIEILESEGTRRQSLEDESRALRARLQELDGVLAKTPPIDDAQEALIARVQEKVRELDVASSDSLPEIH